MQRLPLAGDPVAAAVLLRVGRGIVRRPREVEPARPKMAAAAAAVASSTLMGAEMPSCLERQGGKTWLGALQTLPPGAGFMHRLLLRPPRARIGDPAPAAPLSTIPSRAASSDLGLVTRVGLRLVEWKGELRVRRGRARLQNAKK